MLECAMCLIAHTPPLHSYQTRKHALSLIVLKWKYHKEKSDSRSLLLEEDGVETGLTFVTP